MAAGPTRRSGTSGGSAGKGAGKSTGKRAGRGASRGRPGRTPSIDPQTIERAVRSVGRRGGLGMQSVAGELGVDVTTLYRHVGGVDELRRIWATHRAPGVDEWPSPEGIPWQSWLTRMARHYRTALHETPDLVEHVHTALDPDFEGLERATRILVDYGFEPRAAFYAYSFLLNQVVGFVSQELRQREDAERGVPNFVRLYRALAADTGGARLETLHQLELHPKDLDGDGVFEVFLEYLIGGIRSRPGAPDVREDEREDEDS